MPSTDALKRVFTVLTRGHGILLDKDVFASNGDCRELRALVGASFGQPALEQTREDLQDDLRFIFEHIAADGNCTVTGELAVGNFTKGFCEAMKAIAVLQPESPRLDPKLASRWSRILRGFRRANAQVDRRLPLLALARLAARGWVANVVPVFAKLDLFAMTCAELVDAVGTLTSLRGLVASPHNARAIQLGGACGIGRSSGEILSRELSTLTARARVAVTARLMELQPSTEELATFVVALVPAPAALGLEETPSVETEATAAVERRTLLQAVALRAGEFSADGLAAVAGAVATMGCCEEVELFEAIAARIVALCGSSLGAIGTRQHLRRCEPNSLVDLIWALAQYSLLCLQREGPVNPVAPDYEALSWAAKSVLAPCVGTVPELTNAKLARLCWSMTQLAEGAATPLLREIAGEAMRRAPAMEPCELAHVVYSLAALGHRPLSFRAILQAAVRVCERLEPYDLVRLAAAFGAWGVPADANELPQVWVALRRSVGSLTGDELVLAVVATVRLDIHDDALMRKIHIRSHVVGPFDPQGAGDMLRCLEEYSRRWGCEDVRLAAASFAVAAARHGGAGINFASRCMDPPSLPDARGERMANALRPVIPA